MDRVIVTDHALVRWRQRAAEYADAGPDDVVRAFQGSELVPPDSPVPRTIGPQNGARLYFHPGYGVYFVTKDRGIAGVAIVTVVRPEVVNYLVAKKKQRAKFHEQLSLPPAPQMTKCPPLDGMTLDELRAHRDELKAEVTRLQTATSTAAKGQAKAAAQRIFLATLVRLRQVKQEVIRRSEQEDSFRSREAAAALGLQPSNRRAVAILFDLVEELHRRGIGGVPGDRLAELMAEAHTMAALVRAKVAVQAAGKSPK